MHEVTVRCGCGRTMNLDAPRGRGAFRCGCGARIHVTLNEAAASSACSVTGCRGSSVTGKAIRLCPDHRDEAVMLLATDVARSNLRQLAVLRDEGATKWREPVIPVYDGPSVATTDAAIVREVNLTGKHEPVVYFLLNGDRVKIGYTANLKARLTALSLRPQNLLLLLDGGQNLEYDLHRRFHAHRIADTEWFHFAEEIQEFIKARPQTGRRLPPPRSAPPPLPA
ncbi:GIY-YIG nuclease family protein [Streptomyces sp. ME01-24h]|nr:GIY-YIG nuclease family protein [Streptomyces sp. ME01-24h]